MSDEFEETERSRILKLIREELSFPQIGEVINVWPHTGSEEPPTNHAVDVSIPPGPNPTNTLRRKPFLVPFPGVAAAPKVGDLVLVQYLRGNGDDALVTHVGYGDADKHRAPEADPVAGLFRLTRGNLYIELHPDGDFARLARKPGDKDSPTVKIEIDDANGDINIETDGEDVNVKSGGGDMTLDSEGGQVQIMEGGTPEPVARADHTHSFTYDGGGDNSSQQSGTTDTEDKAPTETEIE